MSEEIGTLEPVSKITYGRCVSCKEDFTWDGNGPLMLARIQRGGFNVDFDEGVTNEVNVKAEFWICKTCYLENPFLCQFFNSIGKRVR
jgi:hypothetical protein